MRLHRLLPTIAVWPAPVLVALSAASVYAQPTTSAAPPAGAVTAGTPPSPSVAPTPKAALPAPATTQAGEEAAPVPAASQVTEPNPAADSTVPVNPEPAPAAPATAVSPSATSTDDDASLAALEAELQGGSTESVADEYKLNLYGFADFMYAYNIKDYNFFNPYSYFAIGKLNLYAGAELGDNWRTLWEVRFTYLPHGSTPVEASASGVPATPTNTNVTDYIDLDRPIRWGGIVLERAWLERTIDTWLTIQVGHFLTPYGIWNVDHGSPVILGVRRPYIVGEALFPESQSGLHFYGSQGFDALRVGYDITVSNGRGPADVFRDFDGNKALGLRLYADWDSPIGKISLGTSAYRGTYTNRSLSYVFDASGFRAERPVTLRYNEFSWAGDLKLTNGGLLVQSEAIMRDVTYDPQYRPYNPPTFGPGGFTADSRSVGVYALAGYRFSFLGIMPWAGWESYKNGIQNSTSAAFWGGFNLRPTPRVVLKAQYSYSYFPDNTGPFKDLHFNGLDFQAAWSF